MELNALECVGLNDVNKLRNICKKSLSSKYRSTSQYDIEQIDKYGNTPLLKACYLKKLDCVTMLLYYGANIRAINYFGQNALTLATFVGSLCIVEELLHYRSYRDFNMSSILPALCVATLQQNQVLINYFQNINRRQNFHIRTVHGLNSKDIKEMLKKIK